MDSHWRVARTAVFCAGVILVGSGSGIARAQEGFSGKLRATGGVSSVEGAGGGGLTPWALITGYGTDRQVGANAHITGAHFKDYALRTGGVAVGLYDRVEFSFSRQAFDTKDVLVPISAALKGYKLEQDTIGVKVRLAGDAIYDQDRWMPQIALGVQHKRNRDDAVIPFLNDALKSNIKNTGTDVYLVASKLFLERSTLLNAGVRLSSANQYGLLGFGGPDGKSARAGFEASFAFLPRRNLAIGAEIRAKRGSLSNAALDLSERAAHDVFIAYFPTKNISVTAAYVNLGPVVGALTNGRKQTGGYLSVQAGF